MKKCPFCDGTGQVPDMPTVLCAPADQWACTCMGGPPRDREEHALRHARYDAEGNRLKNPDGSWYWGV